MAKDSVEIIRTILLRRTVAGNIKALRKKHNMTQKELAALSGIKRETIAKYESFKSFPPLENLLLISQALEESPLALVEGWENIFKSTNNQSS